MTATVTALQQAIAVERLTDYYAARVEQYAGAFGSDAAYIPAARCHALAIELVDAHADLIAATRRLENAS
jgi:hypothetical protein